MFMILTLLSLLSRLQYGNSFYQTCVPNSQFYVNGLICYCDSSGHWTEGSCQISRRQNCKPGQIIWEDCSQCICQENGHLTCTNTMCGDEVPAGQLNKAIDVKRLWCIPFVSYYVNCSLCVCPVSGKMSEARCATDANCPFLETKDYIAAIKNNVCIPKVMYLFPCLHCMCSDDGFFNSNKCVETCKKASLTNVARRCFPRTFYRHSCNICFCPDNSVTNENLCTKAICSNRVNLYPLASLRNRTRRCQRQTFTGSKCFYCECSQDGTVDEKVCLESLCMSIDNFKYNFNKSSCNPGQVVPKCVDCFCPRNGITDPKYCTEDCFNDQKITILEIAIKESFDNRHIVDRATIKTTKPNEACEPNSIYKEQNRYCLCPEDGYTNSKLCTSAIEERHPAKTKINIRGNSVGIDFNTKCDPNTFVEFDCNTCYCLKSGRIDPKWCTYDDCESKKIILNRQKSEQSEAAMGTNDGACTSGSISKEDCNFCICPKNGQLKDRACTKNSCSAAKYKINNVLTCEPLSYYSVDCNICYCPNNGIKNLAKCTKNTCEKSFLRSEVCVPGRLFSEECNVCVCPSNGDKSDRVCTNNTCSDLDTPWKKIFQLSQSLMSYQKMEEMTRNLELCFPGEEFEMGCKVCLCPDMGLRVYATCTQLLCDDEKITKEVLSDTGLANKPVSRTRRNDDCLDFNDSSEKFPCTAGSMYIIKCQQCICPFSGSIYNFCRPMPENFYCEKAYENINYLPPMQKRRTDEKDNASTPYPQLINANQSIDESLKDGATHSHTVWSCTEPGRLMDECFICECKNGVTIQEHCFKSDNTNCSNSWPTFLKKIKPPERLRWFYFFNKTLDLQT